MLKTKAMRFVADKEEGWYWKCKQLIDMLDQVCKRYENAPPSD